MDVVQGGDGSLYLAGVMHLDSTGRDVAIVKYSADGTLQFAKTWGPDNSYDAQAMTIGPSGEIWIVGYVNSNGGDVFILQLNQQGEFVQAKTWGDDTGLDIAQSVTTDTNGNVFVTGKTESFGSGGSDVFLLKFSPSLSSLLEKTWGGSGDEIGYDIEVDSGFVYICGGAPNAYGNWQDITGASFTTVSGSVTAPGVDDHITAAGQSGPSGSESSPTGIEDSGGGGSDCLIIKWNFGA